MCIRDRVLEIVTGRPERLNNRAANAYVVSGKVLSARRDPASQGTYFFIRFGVGKVNSVSYTHLEVYKRQDQTGPHR